MHNNNEVNYGKTNLSCLSNTEWNAKIIEDTAG